MNIYWPLGEINLAISSRHFMQIATINGTINSTLSTRKTMGVQGSLHCLLIDSCLRCRDSVITTNGYYCALIRGPAGSRLLAQILMPAHCCSSAFRWAADRH
jgi:hypothetical protein